MGRFDSNSGVEDKEDFYIAVPHADGGVLVLCADVKDNLIMLNWDDCSYNSFVRLAFPQGS